MSNTELENRIAAKTRDAAPPAPLTVALWATFTGAQPELRRTYDLSDAVDNLILIGDLRGYAHAGVPVEIRRPE